VKTGGGTVMASADYDVNDTGLDKALYRPGACVFEMAGAKPASRFRGKIVSATRTWSSHKPGAGLSGPLEAVEFNVAATEKLVHLAGRLGDERFHNFPPQNRAAKLRAVSLWLSR
jgi:hypothetical protein